MITQQSYLPTASSTVRVRYIFSRHPDPGVVTVRASFQIPSSVESLRVQTTEHNADQVTIIRDDGFRKGNTGTEWHWNSHADTPSLTMQYTVNESDPVFGGANFLGTNAWALFSTPSLEIDWRYQGTPPRFTQTRQLADGVPGYVTSEIVYLGESKTYESTRNDEQFTLVVPSAAESPEEPTNATAIFDTLEIASGLLDVGGENRGIVVFRGPKPLRSGGFTASNHNTSNTTATESFWVQTGEGANSSVFFSEYIHTRQEFTVSGRMEWITEAQDSYYSALIALYRGTTSYRAFYETVSTTEHANQTIASESRTTRRRAADYTKGARVLTALDLQIRNTTHRNRSFEDVWRHMNEYDGTVTYADFKDIVARVAGQRLDNWLDRYLTTDATPVVPDNQSRYAPVEPGLDSDNDGLNIAAELDNGTKPFTADTDGDGVIDGSEVRRDSNPLMNPAKGTRETNRTSQGDHKTVPSLRDSPLVVRLAILPILGIVAALAIRASNKS